MSGWLDPELTRLAFCWRVERRDGIAIGLTSHDRTLFIEGLAYDAAPGMLPSAIVRTSGLEPDTLSISGALSGDAISAADLEAGRWDGARVTLFAVDWGGAGEPVLLGRGELGAVTLRDHGYAAELAGETALLAMPAVETTSPDCRAELGDRRCRVDMSKRRRFARVTAIVDAARLTTDQPEPSPNAYGNGRLRVFEGQASGLAAAIAHSEGSLIALSEPLPIAVTVGALVELIEGCDYLLDTCAARFGNALNFRGEPHLPGIDLLTRYPGA